ncbi:MAG: type II toxin-antitoxin system RelE/ParE family toxin [Agarilytica sp.]
MGSYKLSEDAKKDLIRIHQWGVQQHGEKAADEYYNDFFRHFELIAEAPYSYQSVEDIRPGYRRCPCGADAIYYRVVNDVVEFMAIIGNQNLGDWL